MLAEGWRCSRAPSSVTIWTRLLRRRGPCAAGISAQCMQRADCRWRHGLASAPSSWRCSRRQSTPSSSRRWNGELADRTATRERSGLSVEQGLP